jgi:hypothetical protein
MARTCGGLYEISRSCASSKVLKKPSNNIQIAAVDCYSQRVCELCLVVVPICSTKLAERPSMVVVCRWEECGVTASPNSVEQSK